MENIIDITRRSEHAIRSVQDVYASVGVEKQLEELIQANTRLICELKLIELEFRRVYEEAKRIRATRARDESS